MGFLSNISMVLPECPHCRVKKVAFYLSSEQNKDRGEGYISFWICSNCQGGFVGESKESAKQNTSMSYSFNAANFMKTYPNPEPPEAPAFTPQKIAETFVTAISVLRCASTGKPTASDAEACCIMVRRAVELAVKEQEAEGNNLYKKIENLADRHILTASMREWAHEIRLIGNEGAHGDEEITSKDAEQALYFAEMLFQYLYTLPGMIAERRNTQS